MLSLLALAALAALPLSLAQFNNPPGVDIWCGKAYRAGNASFEPGGWLYDPPESSDPLLDFKLRPRMNLYLDTDTEGSLLIDAGISYLVGHPLYAAAGAQQNSSSLAITITSNGQAIGNSSIVEVDTVNNEIPISLTYFPPSMTPYNISVVGRLVSNSSTTFTAKTQLVRLPSRTDGGSVTRLDNLYGGLSVRKGNETEWNLIFPYTYYVQWPLYWHANLSTLDEFSSMGYNVIHIVPDGDLANTPFPWSLIQPYLDRAAQLGLYLQYDVRFDPTNYSIMTDQVTHLHTHPSLLLYYTADEPDGKANPLNSTSVAREIIRAIDPYHPVSLALNCYNFYYAEYSSGADIVLSDPYPISTNVSFSTVYDTPCNLTYGCCGCDDCKGSFEDLSERLDNFAHFDDLLGATRTHWGVPQAFGNDSFWTRNPTAAEEVVMDVLSVNHAAKGLVMWDFPTTTELMGVTHRLAAVLTSTEVTDFVLGAPLTKQLNVTGAERIDGAAWTAEAQVLLSVVNLNYGDVNGTVSVALPDGVKAGAASSTLWGSVEWAIDGNTVSTSGLLGLEVSLVVLDLE